MLKCGCLVDFFAISLPIMRAYTHAHTHSLFKTGRKSTYILIDRFTYVEKMVIVYSNQKNRIKMGFLYSVLFYGHLNRFVRLCDFITFLWLAMWLFVLGCGIP